MHPNPRRIAPVVLLVAAALAAWWYFNNKQNSVVESGLAASGTIEATQVLVAPELGGHVLEVLVQEGDAVNTGDVLVRFDDALLQAQLKQAQAALAQAEASYNLVARGPTTEQRSLSIAAAEMELTNASIALKNLQENAPLTGAQLAQSIAAIDQARDKAQQFLDNVNTRASQADIDAAWASVVLAQDKLENAQEDFEPYENKDQGNVTRAMLQAQMAAAQKQYDSAVERYNNLVGTANQYVLSLAQAEVTLAQARLADMQNQQETLQDGVDPDALAQAQARLKTAEASLAAAAAPTSPEQIALAQAQVELARSAALVLETQIKKLVIKAPASGVILTRSVEPGEVAVMGAPLLTLARLDDLTITVYVSEARYGEINLGQEVRVSVDSFPGEVFNATVTRIADQAEFTPRNVQTEEGRRTTVYAIELGVANPDGRLKPGMPADVIFSR